MSASAHVRRGPGGDDMRLEARTRHIHVFDLLGLGLPLSMAPVFLVVAVVLNDPLVFMRAVFLIGPYVLGYIVARVLELPVEWTALLAGAVILLLFGLWLIDRDPEWLSLRRMVSLWLMYGVAPATGMAASVLIDRLARIKGG